MNYQGSFQPSITIRIYESGPKLLGVAVIPGFGQFTATVDRRRVAAIVQSMRGQQTLASAGNIFDDIGEGISKIAKSTVIQKIVSVAKDVASSPIFKTAISYVPFAGPVLANADIALGAAQKALDAAGSAARLLDQAKKGNPKARQAIKVLARSKSPVARKALQNLAKVAKAPPADFQKLLAMAPVNVVKVPISKIQNMNTDDFNPGTMFDGLGGGADDFDIMASAGAYYAGRPMTNQGMVRLIDTMVHGRRKLLGQGLLTRHIGVRN